MFGYVKPKTGDLLVKDRDFYRAVYCGICHGMQKETGLLSRSFLTYDSVFLALVRMCFLRDDAFHARGRVCVAHPLKKRQALDENEAITYAARVFALLSYHQLLDDLSDESAAKRAALLPLRPVLASARRRAKLPELDGVITGCLFRIGEMERAKTASVDEPASVFGELLREVFSYGLSGDDALVAGQIGYHLGKFIYAADAAEDYDEDVRLGRYNPYALLYGGKPLTGENKESIRTGLLLTCAEIGKAADLLPAEGRRTLHALIDNIVRLGLVDRISFLDATPPIPQKTKERRHDL